MRRLVVVEHSTEIVHVSKARSWHEDDVAFSHRFLCGVVAMVGTWSIAPFSTRATCMACIAEEGQWRA